MDESVVTDVPRSLRLEQHEEEIHELRLRIDKLEALVHNILGINEPLKATR